MNILETKVKINNWKGFKKKLKNNKTLKKQESQKEYKKYRNKKYQKHWKYLKETKQLNIKIIFKKMLKKIKYYESENKNIKDNAKEWKLKIMFKLQNKNFVAFKQSI